MFFPIDPPATTLDKISEKLRPLLPYFNDGKSGAFWLWREFIVNSGEGVVFSISHFFSVQDCSPFLKKIYLQLLAFSGKQVLHLD